MIVNKYKILQNNIDEYKLVLPIQSDNFYLGLDQGVEIIENEVVEEIIGLPKNYEISRFSFLQPTFNKTNSSLNFKFRFFDTSVNDWVLSYLPIFDPIQIYYNTNAFSNSFFKLDFYDTNEKRNQKIIFTLIIPTQQGKTESSQIFPSWYPDEGFVNLKTPNFELDYLQDREGYFIYFLSDPSIINITNFYVSFKFFDGNIGQFKTFLTSNPSSFTNNNFDPNEYSFLKVELDYSNFTYKYKTLNNIEVGDINSPITLYEYINP
jgi:hypothetical protein